MQVSSDGDAGDLQLCGASSRLRGVEESPGEAGGGKEPRGVSWGSPMGWVGHSVTTARVTSRFVVLCSVSIPGDVQQVMPLTAQFCE